MKSSGIDGSTLSENVVEYILTRGIDEFENLNVRTIAKKFDINRCYLSHRFKCDTSYSLHEYILKIKILRSLVELQENGDITIGEIAKRMGFSDCDYFRRIFKQRVGITPGKYKNCFKK